MTMQGIAALSILEFMPEIINEINQAIPEVDITSNPKVILALKACAIATTVAGRLRAKTNLK